MAQIRTFTAQRGLNPQSTPVVETSSYVAQAVQNVGAQAQNVVGMLQERQAKKDNFAAENAYRRFQIEVGADLANTAQNIQPGGQGFHDQFLTDVFKPKRDAFLASIPENLRPRFEEVLADETGADFADWSTQAATVERDEGYRWAKEEITLTQQQMATAIAMDPDSFDDYLNSGKALIDSAVLPTPEKALMTQQWEEMAQVAYLNTLLKDDPQAVLRELGVDARQLSPTTQFDILSRAVQWQESTDNPNAISPKGAVGLMQVMPGTARDIAAALGDQNFPTGENDTVIAAYLSNPFVNKRYGEEYLRQQLRTFGATRNPIETALVAYNAGPSVAQAWVESGYDDSILPKETRDYKKAILDTISSPVAKGDPSAVKFVASGGNEPADLEGVNPDLTARVADAFATLGIERVRINSAHRTHEENEAAGGAENSQHLEGGAMDINVSGMAIPQRIELIKALSAAGVTGIGIGANIIHADIGGRRAWGYATSAGGGEVPGWAAGVISEHLKGTTPPPLAVAGNLSSLPYDRRQTFITQADQAITAQRAASTKASAVQMVEVRSAMENELATVRTTGAPSGTFNATDISTVLGEDDYLRYTQQLELARKTFAAVDGLATMSTEDMARRIEDYAPIPGTTNFAQQQEVQAAAQRESERVIKLRANDPAAAAMEFPEVEAAYKALQTEMGTGEPDPNNVQAFVRLMLEKQAQFDVAPAARAPVPADWAVEIGRALSRVPEPGRGNIEDVRYAIQAQYNSLKQFFGDYADEVMIYSLAEYKGMSPTTAETVTGYMQAIQAGRDPFSRGVTMDQAQDMDQVDSLSFWDQVNPFSTVNNLLGGQPGGTSEAPAGMTPEEMLRAATPEE